MSPWKAHWDHQLYKALEFQYKMGLEALNENLPEIKVDITYRYVVGPLAVCSSLCMNFSANKFRLMG